MAVDSGADDVMEVGGAGAPAVLATAGTDGILVRDISLPEASLGISLTSPTDPILVAEVLSCFPIALLDPSCVASSKDGPLVADVTSLFDVVSSDMVTLSFFELILCMLEKPLPDGLLIAEGALLVVDSISLRDPILA